MKNLGTKETATLLMAAMLVVAATTAFTTYSALAEEDSDTKKKTQAVSGLNDCGNGDTPVDVFCQDLASEIQGDGNSATVSGTQD